MCRGGTLLTAAKHRSGSDSLQTWELGVNILPLVVMAMPARMIIHLIMSGDVERLKALETT